MTDDKVLEAMARALWSYRYGDIYFQISGKDIPDAHAVEARLQTLTNRVGQRMNRMIFVPTSVLIVPKNG